MVLAAEGVFRYRNPGIFRWCMEGRSRFRGSVSPTGQSRESFDIETGAGGLERHFRRHGRLSRKGKAARIPLAKGVVLMV